MLLSVPFCELGAATTIASFQIYRSRRHLETLMVICTLCVNVVSPPTFRQLHVRLCIIMSSLCCFGRFTSRALLVSEQRLVSSSSVEVQFKFQQCRCRNVC